MSVPRPRVLMLTTQLGYGGAETSFIRLANALAQTMDVTVALFTQDYGAGAYAKGHAPLDAPVRLLDGAGKEGRARRWFNRIRRLRKLKAEHDVTISFLSGPNLVNALAGYRSRTVISLRGSRRYDPVAPRFMRMLFQYLLDPIAYLLSARIVVVSPGLTQEVLFLAQPSVVVIPPFIDAAKMEEGLAAPLPGSYAKLAGQPVIAVVGRLSVEKGLEQLLPILVSLSAKLPGVKLLLVGDGPSATLLRAIAAASGLAVDALEPGVSSVVFTGYQPQVLPFMRLARVLVLPSLTEGFPSVLLEGMAADLPVIANDAPWGARAILREDASVGVAAHPTVMPTETPFGTLMPRIDLPANHAMWVDYLHRELQSPTPRRSRVADFTLEAVLPRWQRLIDEVMRP